MKEGVKATLLARARAGLALSAFGGAVMRTGREFATRVGRGCWFLHGDVWAFVLHYRSNRRSSVIFWRLRVPRRPAGLVG